ncbi:hypothetical protein ACWDMR_00020 [Streptomyces althioticus]
MSLETGVQMLCDAGYPIEDVTEEIERIRQRAFDQAARLADATGDNAAVREYLGLTGADPEVFVSAAAYSRPSSTACRCPG